MYQVIMDGFRPGTNSDESLTPIEIVANDIVHSFAWVEAIDVDQEANGRHAQMTVYHSYPDGVNIQPFIKSTMIHHKQYVRCSVEIVYKRVKPGYGLED